MSAHAARRTPHRGTGHLDPGALGAAAVPLSRVPLLQRGLPDRRRTLSSRWVQAQPVGDRPQPRQRPRRRIPNRESARRGRDGAGVPRASPRYGPRGRGEDPVWGHRRRRGHARPLRARGQARPQHPPPQRGLRARSPQQRGPDLRGVRAGRGRLSRHLPARRGPARARLGDGPHPRRARGPIRDSRPRHRPPRHQAVEHPPRP